MMSSFFLFALLFAIGYNPAEAETCACAKKINKALIDSLKGCTEAAGALLSCEEEKPPKVNIEDMIKVRIEADSCTCAKKATKPLSESLDGCVDAVKALKDCGTETPPSF